MSAPQSTPARGHPRHHHQRNTVYTPVGATTQGDLVRMVAVPLRVVLPHWRHDTVGGHLVPEITSWQALVQHGWVELRPRAAEGLARWCPAAQPACHRTAACMASRGEEPPAGPVRPSQRSLHS